MYFYLASSIVDRDDLTLYEKMACVVMARYANQQAFDGLISVDILALKMGVSPDLALTALESLIEKGLIEREFLDKQPLVKSNVIKAPKETAPAHFDPVDPPELSQVEVKPTQIQAKSSEPKVEEVTSEDIQALFEEVVSRRQALMLFELAGRDFDFLKSTYLAVKATTSFDVVDHLFEVLQKQPQTAPEEGGEKTGITEDEPHSLITDQDAQDLFTVLEKRQPRDSEDSGKKINNQINLNRIQSLYKKQMKK